MSQSALPVATGPRTITVRVRTLLIAAAVVVAAVLVWWTLGYATGMQPLSTGSATTAPHGLRIAARTPDAFGSGPTAYVWRPGGSYVVTVQIHNSASVPVTITGVGHTPSGWVGAISGPTIENGDGGTLEPINGPFHHVRIGAPMRTGRSRSCSTRTRRRSVAVAPPVGWIPLTCSSRRSAFSTTPRPSRWVSSGP